MVGATYNPSDDTFLLAKAVKSYGKVIDLGSGSGYITTLLAMEGNYVVAIDISPFAVLSTWRTVIRNSVSELVDVIQCDGLKCLRPCKCFKAIFINPPYLPVLEFESWYGVTWSGGKEGIEVFLKMIKGVETILSKGGEIVFVHSSLSNINKLLDTLHTKGFCTEELDRKCFYSECILLFKSMVCNDETQSSSRRT